MARGHGSKVLASVHETALGMTEAGVMAKSTMRAFDEMCLTQVETEEIQTDEDARTSAVQVPTSGHVATERTVVATESERGLHT